MNYTTHIGLIRTQDICLPAFPSGVSNVSDSGVFVSDLDESPLSLLHGPVIWDKLADDRIKAGNQLHSDLVAMLSTIYVPKGRWSGTVGGKTQNQFVLASETSLPIATRFLAGGSLHIRSLGLKTNVAVTLTVSLFEEGNTTAIQTEQITTTTGETAKLLSPAWRIPLDGKTYTLRATLPTGTRYADNDLSCGCGGNSARISTYISNSMTSKAGGFLLELETACSYADFPQRIADDSRTGLVLAYMHAYLTAYFALRRTANADADGVNRETVLPGEVLLGRAGATLDHYNNRLKWLRSELPRDFNTNHSCYHCPPSSQRGAFSY